MLTEMKVLLADDDEDDREIFSEALADVDGSVTYLGVEDGPDAIALLSDNVVPNIIFLDLNMPVMNGWDVLKKIRMDSRYDNIPVIIYTTSAGSKEKQAAFDLGAFCFVTKPESVKLIKAMLKIVLENLKQESISPKTCLEIQRALRQAV